MTIVVRPVRYCAAMEWKLELSFEDYMFTEIASWKPTSLTHDSPSFTREFLDVPKMRITDALVNVPREDLDSSDLYSWRSIHRRGIGRDVSAASSA